MKISKFLWSVLVAFATVALIAPQQVEAIIVDGRISGQIVLTGSGTITESNGINSNGINSNGISGSVINELDFNGQLFPHGPLSVTNATDDFFPFVGSQATFNLAIRWTGSDSSVHPSRCLARRWGAGLDSFRSSAPTVLLLVRFLA